MQKDTHNPGSTRAIEITNSKTLGALDSSEEEVEEEVDEKDQDFYFSDDNN